MRLFILILLSLRFSVYDSVKVSSVCVCVCARYDVLLFATIFCDTLVFHLNVFKDIQCTVRAQFVNVGVYAIRFPSSPLWERIPTRATRPSRTRGISCFICASSVLHLCFSDRLGFIFEILRDCSMSFVWGRKRWSKLRSQTWTLSGLAKESGTESHLPHSFVTEFQKFFVSHISRRMF